MTDLSAIRAFLVHCNQAGFGHWRWPSGEMTEISALYITNWAGYYTAAECRDGQYYPAYYEVRLEELDLIVLSRTKLEPLLALGSPAAALRSLREQARWPRATDAAAQAGVTVGRINQLLHMGQLSGEKRGVEWYVDPASLVHWMTDRKPGRPRKDTDVSP